MNSTSRRLRIIGLGIICGGLAVAGVLYLGRKPELPEDSSTVGFYKASSRQMGVMYGQFGVMVDELAADLKRPRVQAVVVLVLAAIGGIVCFHFARLLESPGPEQNPRKEAAHQ